MSLLFSPFFLFSFVVVRRINIICRYLFVCFEVSLDRGEIK